MIWVTGSAGMLGREVSLLFERLRADGDAAFESVGTDRETDITDAEAVADFIRGKRADWIVNCAAYTAVDKAEDEPEACRRLNAGGPAVLAGAARESGARLVHISTDYVFGGKGTRPYREDDPATPGCVYGRTKLEGEREALKRDGRAYIIRAAWLYGEHGKNFVDTMLRLMREREEIRVVDDQTGSPTWAGDVARGVASLIGAVESGKEVPPGAYHYVNEGAATRREFSQAICEEGRKRGILTSDRAVLPCSTDEYPAKAARPAYSVLDTAKIKAALGITIPHWRDALAGFIAKRAASASPNTVDRGKV